MNKTVRSISALALILLFGACGASEASESVAVPADSPMRSAMATCVGIWMDEVVPVVAKTLGDPGQMSRIQLEQCGNRRIAIKGIAAGYACNPDGCYASDGHGFDWTDAAREWACDNNRPDVCALAE